jgi:hypothetical protein
LVSFDLGAGMFGHIIILVVIFDKSVRMDSLVARVFKAVGKNARIFFIEKDIDAAETDLFTYIIPKALNTLVSNVF